MVGVGTVLTDDPKLTVRHVSGPSPKRVILDSRLRTPSQAQVLGSSPDAPLIFHGPDASLEKRDMLRDKGAELIEVSRVGDPDTEDLNLKEVLNILGKKQIVRLLVEGGPRLFGSLLTDRYFDRLLLFMAPKILGAKSGLNFAQVLQTWTLEESLALHFQRVRRMGPDLMIEALRQGSSQQALQGSLRKQSDKPNDPRGVSCLPD